MLAQPKLFSWATAKNRIVNQLYYSSTFHEDHHELAQRRFSILPQLRPYPLFTCRVNQSFSPLDRVLLLFSSSYSH